MFLYHLLLEIEKRQGSSKALVYRDAYLSWRGLLERVDRRAQELRSFGITKGAWVGLMLGNVPEFVILALALSKLETTFIPMDPTLGLKELHALLDLFPFRALITRPRGGMDPSTSPPVSSMRKRKSLYSSTLPPPPPDPQEPEMRKRLQGTLLTCSLYKPKQVLPEVSLPKEAPLLFLTTNTKGAPKGVFRSEQNLMTSVDWLQTALAVQPDDRILALLPLCRASSFENHFLLALRSGATLYMEEETLPMRIIKLLRDQEITVFLGTPRIYASLTHLPVSQTHLTHKNTQYLSGSQSLPSDIQKEFQKRFGPSLSSLYRTTEGGNISIDIEGSGTLGLPFPGIQIDFRSAESSQHSTLWVRSPAVSSHFVEASETEDFFSSPVGNVDPQGWLCTGDLGWLDEKGRIILEGREDDLVKIEGNRVMLHEIDQCLKSHPLVREAKTSLITDAEQTSVLTAKVFCFRPCPETELMDYCAQRLNPYKVPRRIEVRSESLRFESVNE